MRYGEFAVTDTAQDVFGRMRHGLQPGKAQETARTLDGVHHPEDAAEKRRIAGSLFQFHDLAVQNVEGFAGLCEKILEEIVHFHSLFKKL